MISISKLKATLAAMAHRELRAGVHADRIPFTDEWSFAGEMDDRDDAVGIAAALQAIDALIEVAEAARTHQSAVAGVRALSLYTNVSQAEDMRACRSVYDAATALDAALAKVVP